jgi:hypothetical protein
VVGEYWFGLVTVGEPPEVGPTSMRRGTEPLPKGRIREGAVAAKPETV